MITFGKQNILVKNAGYLADFAKTHTALFQSIYKDGLVGITQGVNDGSLTFKVTSQAAPTFMKQLEDAGLQFNAIV